MDSVELPVADDRDRARLQQLGYKQELKRGLSYEHTHWPRFPRRFSRALALLAHDRVTNSHDSLSFLSSPWCLLMSDDAAFFPTSPSPSPSSPCCALLQFNDDDRSSGTDPVTTQPETRREEEKCAARWREMGTVGADQLPVAADRDRARLQQLGYKQELKRGLSVVSNFAFSFAIISVLTGVTTTYNTGLRYGGPASMTLGWLVVAAFNACVALSMAEICSAYPTSGGLYYWSAKLAGKEWAPLASWVTGWFNIVGQWACTASVDFSLAQLIQVMILLGTGGATGGGYLASKYVVLTIYTAILVVHGLINSLPIRWLSWFGQLGAFWNVAGVFALVVLVPSVARERASAGFIFAHFNADDGAGIHSRPYILAVGLLMAQYSCLGYDTSAHMTEETKNAEWSGPMGIVCSVALSGVFGWIYLLALTSVVTDIPYLLDAGNDAGGYAIAQALYTTFHRRYGTGAGGIVCLGIVAVAVFLCGTACVTSNSRMGYAFSRDGAMPLSRVWHRVNKNEVPLNVVWLSVFVAFLMALTSLGSQVAFQAMVSITTLGLYIAYALPIFFRVTTARDSFVPGPFHLGKFGIAIGAVAVLWVALVTVLFCLPVAYPVDKDTFNYTPAAVGGVLLLSLAAWVLHARFWFRGPITNVDHE